MFRQVDWWWWWMASTRCKEGKLFHESIKCRKFQIYRWDECIKICWYIAWHRNDWNVGLKCYTIIISAMENATVTFTFSRNNLRRNLKTSWCINEKLVKTTSRKWITILKKWIKRKSHEGNCSKNQYVRNLWKTAVKLITFMNV